jgi:transposase InsO family protein
MRLLDDCVDADTGEICPVVIVTDNGPAMKSIAVARWFAARPELTHVRTRHRSPHTNGVVERWFESLKHERLYRHDIATGLDLAAHVAEFIDEYNTVRPHEALDWRRPIDAYLTDPTLKPSPPGSVQES